MMSGMTTTPDDGDEVEAPWIARLRHAAQSGKPLDLAPVPADESEDQDAADTYAGQSDRRLPAAALRTVLTNQDPDIDPRGLQIKGAWIAGLVDLKHLRFDHPLHLTECYFENDIELAGSALKELNLSGSHVRSLNLDDAAVTGAITATDGFTAHGTISATGARIGGALDLSGAVLTNQEETALNLDSVSVAGGLFASDGFISHGAVSVINGALGRLNLDGATLIAPGRTALNLDGVRIAGDWSARDKFAAHGEVRATGALVDGQLLLCGTFVNPEGDALTLDQSTVVGGVFGRGGFIALGAVSAMDAKLSSFDLAGATLSHPSGTALDLDRVEVAGGLSLSDGFEAHGEIRARASNIGYLHLDSATLINRSGCALNLEGARITGGLLARDTFTAHGAISAAAATVNRLELDGATLTNPGKTALTLESGTVTTLKLKPSQVDGTIDLTRSTISDLQTPPDSVPAGHLKANGWQITDISGQIRTGHRWATQWLSNTPPEHSFSAQPWHALASVYERNGQPADARRMRVKAARSITKHAPWYSKPLRWIYGATAGHGYYPLLAGGWLIVAVVLGTILISYNRADFVPTDRNAARSAATTYALNNPDMEPPAVVTAQLDCAYYPEYPCLNRAVYSLTSVVPVALGNPKADWAPRSEASLLITWGLLLLRILSWIFTAILLAGVTGLLKKS